MNCWRLVSQSECRVLLPAILACHIIKKIGAIKVTTLGTDVGLGPIRN